MASLLMVGSMRENAHVRQHVQDEKVEEQEAPACGVAQKAPREVQSQSLHCPESVFCLPSLFLGKLFEWVDRRLAHAMRWHDG